MPETNRREQTQRRDSGSEVRVVVEVDGNPVGFLELDMDRLWPLINHGKRDGMPVEWMDRPRFEAMMRAVVSKSLISRLEQHLYRTLGDEIVKTEIDIEAFLLKAEGAAQAFGRTQADVDKLVEESGRPASEFYTFFWDYLLDDRDTDDPKKEWKASRIRPQ